MTDEGLAFLEVARRVAPDILWSLLTHNDGHKCIQAMFADVSGQVWFTLGTIPHGVYEAVAPRYCLRD